MKKFIHLLIAIVALASCSENPIHTEQPNKKTGKLNLSVEAKNNFATNVKAAADPDAADFTIVISTSDGNEWRRWDKLGDGIAIADIPEGNYTIEAFHGAKAAVAAAWDTPHYYGKSPFDINAGQTTDVAVTATISNAKVTLTYTEKLLDQVKDIEVVVTGVDGGVLTYTPTETRDGFFAVPDNSIINIVVTGTRKSNDAPLQINSTIKGVLAAKWYKVTLDLVSTSGNGNVQLAIDKTLVEKEENIEIPDEDDIIGGGGGGTTPDPDPDPEPGVTPPAITGASFNGSPFDIDQTLTITPADIEAAGDNGITLDVLIKAEGKINNLNVEIISPTLDEGLLSSMGLWGEFDIANPTEATRETLTDLGLIDPNSPIKGKTSHTFSVGSFMGLLAMVGGEKLEHSFKLTVIDVNGGSTTKTLKVYLAE